MQRAGDPPSPPHAEEVEPNTQIQHLFEAQCFASESDGPNSKYPFMLITRPIPISALSIYK